MTAALLRAVLSCAFLILADAAWAQLSGSVTLTSDYRFRGISLSDEKPALQGARECAPFMTE